jgi:hypothetical protein
LFSVKSSFVLVSSLFEIQNNQFEMSKMAVGSVQFQNMYPLHLTRPLLSCFNVSHIPLSDFARVVLFFTDRFNTTFTVHPTRWTT